MGHPQKKRGKIRFFWKTPDSEKVKKTMVKLQKRRKREIPGGKNSTKISLLENRRFSY